MIYRLALHRECDSRSILGIEVALAHHAGELSLTYRIMGSVASVAVPSEGIPQRRDGLWQHTCCEAFLWGADRDDYCEFNFSPSTAWAAYRFASYRQDMTPLETPQPNIEVQRSERMLMLTARVQLPQFVQPGGSGARAPNALRIGLSAVIEELSGAKSYWALAHPPGKPDFHHALSFVGMADLNL